MLDKKWLGKKVFIKLKSNSWSYLGRVIEENNDFITIIDINGKRVALNINSIEIIKEDAK